MNSLSTRTAVALTLCAGAATAIFFGSTSGLKAVSQPQPQPANFSTAPTGQNVLVTTTESVEGFQIKEYRGIVRGVTVREPGPMSNFKVSIKSIVGGKMSPYIRVCETAREQALAEMVQKAQAMGANAVVAFRYDSSAFGDNESMGTEVVCYGTAVTVVPKDSTHTVSMLP